MGVASGKGFHNSNSLLPVNPYEGHSYDLGFRRLNRLIPFVAFKTDLLVPVGYPPSPISSIATQLATRVFYRSQRDVIICLKRAQNQTLWLLWMARAMYNLPFPVIRSDERRFALGWTLSAIGWFSIFSGFSVCFWLAIRFTTDLNLFLGFILAIGILASFYTVAFPRLVTLILRGRKMRAPRALDIVSSGGHAFVVLLRSFEDDDLIDPLLPATYQIAPGRYEERLVKALRLIGPAVALGRPEEPVPELGAARLYVKNEYWQVAITYLLEKAGAVVAIVGKSPCLWWEVELALSLLPPDKLIFFFPYVATKEVRHSYLRTVFLQNPVFAKWLRRSVASEMDVERERRYQLFRERFGPMFKGPLPPKLGRVRFLHLDKEGRPRFVEPTKPTLLTQLATMNFSAQLDIPFSKELRPFAQELKARTSLSP